MSSPLIDWAKGIEQKFESAANKIPTPGYKSPSSKTEADPGMVKEANEAFRKDAERKRGTTMKSSPTSGATKAARKPAKRKAGKGK
jgi:hypothetical protein